MATATPHNHLRIAQVAMEQAAEIARDDEISDAVRSLSAHTAFEMARTAALVSIAESLDRLVHPERSA